VTPHRKVRSSALLDDGLDEFSPIDLSTPLVVRRPSSRACSLDAATFRGRDACVAAHEWPPFDAQRKIVMLRLRPGTEDNAGAGAGHDRH